MKNREYIPTKKQLTDKLFDDFNNTSSSYVPNNTVFDIIEDVEWDITVGTSVTHILQISELYKDYSDIQVTYSQNTVPKIVKNLNDLQVTIFDDIINIEVNLTPEETIRFRTYTFGELQVKIVINDEVFTSSIYKVKIFNELNKENI